MNFDWQDLLMNKGPLWAVFAMFIWILWVVAMQLRNYGPRIAEAHIEMVTDVKAHSERSTVALETLAESANNSESHHSKTHRALEHALDAAREHIDDPKVRNHLDKAARVLGEKPCPPPKTCVNP